MKPQERKQRKNPFIKFLVLLFITVFASLAFVYFQYNSSVETPHTGSSAQVLVEIEYGSSVKDIAKLLKEKDVIRDERVFEVYVRINSLENVFLAGLYETSGNKTIPEVIEDLQNEIDKEVRVTIPEGLMYIQIADRLDKILVVSPNWSKEEFLRLAETPGSEFSEFTILESKPIENSLEGYLFPDTYLFDINISSKEVIQKMLANTEVKLSGQLGQDIQASEFTTYEVLNFAAMIERETIEYSDREIVGDILYRRYTEGWPLGIDATLLYEHKDWKYLITQEDIDTPTPYNTRIHKGLPPTPISNPGISSIEGFIYRKPNEYYYYVSDPNGKIYYAETFSEHSQNIAKYVR